MDLIKKRKNLLIAVLVLIINSAAYYVAFIRKDFQANAIEVFFPNRLTLIKYSNIIIIGILVITNLLVLVVILLKRKYPKRFEFIYSKKFLYTVLISITTLFVLLIYKKYFNFETYTYDLAIQFQTIWNTANGRFFQSGIETSNFLGDHFSPLLIIPVVVYKLVPNILTLFVVQALCVLIGAIGIYYLSKEIVKNKFIPILLPIIFILYPSISGLFLYDFHEIVLALPFLIWGLYFYHKKNNVFLLLFLIAALAKEDVGIFIGSFGIYILLVKRDLKGLLLAVAGFLYSVLALLYIIPSIRKEDSDTLWRYNHWGNTGSEIIKSILTRPVEVIQYSFQHSKILYLLRLFIPVGFLLFFAPFALLILLPNLFINLLSGSAAQNSNLFQYDVMNTISIFYISILGISNLEKWSRKYKVNIIRIFIIVLIPINAVILLVHPLWQPLKLSFYSRAEDYQKVMDFKRTLPPEAIVSTSNSVGAFFADREKLQLFFPEYGHFDEDPDYIIVDKKVDYITDMNIKIKKYIEEKNYKVNFDSDTLEILSKL